MPYAAYDAYEYTAQSHSYLSEMSPLQLPSAKFSFHPSPMQVRCTSFFSAQVYSVHKRQSCANMFGAQGCAMRKHIWCASNLWRRTRAVPVVSNKINVLMRCPCMRVSCIGLDSDFVEAVLLLHTSSQLQFA